MAEHKVSIAAIQPPYPADDSLAAHMATRERGIALASQAAAKGCDFICLPEYFNCVGLSPADSRREAQLAAEVRTRVAEIAAASGAYVLLPVLEERPQGLFNAIHLINRDGHVVYTYDKTHLTIAEKQDWGVRPGDRVAVFETPHAPVAVATCYDMYFPEYLRALALRGARLIFFPSLQRSDSPEAVAAMLAVRAMDSFAYLVRSSYGSPAGSAWRPGMPYGMSRIVHPDGSVLADAGRYEGFALAVVDLAHAWRRTRCHGRPPEPVRDFITQDRRPELYGDLTRPLGQGEDT